MRAITILLTACLAAILQPAAAQPKWAQGQTYNGNIDLGGVQVPLPPGQWTVAGFGDVVTKATAGADSGSQTSVGLTQIADGKLRAYISVTYNHRSLSNGWNVFESAQCRRSEIHHARIVRDRQTDRSCQFVNHTTYSVGTNSAKWWLGVIDQVRAAKISMPHITFLNGIVVSDRANFFALGYYFNPEFAGFAAPAVTAWETSEWNVLNVDKDVKKKAFVQSMIDWTEKSRPVVEAGLAGKLKKGEGLDWPTAMQ